MILKIAFKQAPGTMLLGHCNKILFSECKVQVKDQQTKGKIMLQKKNSAKFKYAMKKGYNQYNSTVLLLKNQCNISCFNWWI